MDNWHVTPRLSLQLGLRYDALPHAWERSNAVANFDPAALPRRAQTAAFGTPTVRSIPTGPGFQTVNGVRFLPQRHGPRGPERLPARVWLTNDYNTLQPRVGFSEDIFGNGKTVLRGGFGTFYERMQGNDIYNAATNPPFAYNPSASNVYLTEPDARAG